MKKRRVADPVQVYLEPADHARLERLARQLDTTKSEVLRRGVDALERQLLDSAPHPALRLIGLAAAERPGVPTLDAGLGHDAALADAEETAWTRGRRRRGR